MIDRPNAVEAATPARPHAADDAERRCELRASAEATFLNRDGDIGHAVEAGLRLLELDRRKVGAP